MSTHRFLPAEPKKSPQGHDRYVCATCGLVTQLNDKQSLNPHAICCGNKELREGVARRILDETNGVWCSDNPVILPDWRQVLGGPERLDYSIFPTRWSNILIPSVAEEIWLPVMGNPIFWCESGIVTIASGAGRVLVARKGTEQYKYGKDGILIRVS